MQSNIDERIFEMQAEVAGAMAHPVRLHILELISDGERATQDLLTELDIPKGNLSQHIAVLRSAGILHVRREGRAQHVSLALPRIKEACRLIRQLLMEKLIAQEKQFSELKQSFSEAI